MKPRKIAKKIKDYAKSFPIVTITGPRQSGKTTLVKFLFPDKPYVTLEDIDERQYAEQDPRGFLAQFPEGAILDEIQRVPELLSYLQGIVDSKNKEGLFILTGSQQFELLSSINQSLAGRTAIAKLLPFSLHEAYEHPENESIDEILCRGFYPRIFDKQMNPSDMLSFYLQTYVERDIRQLISIKDLSIFETFIKLCAGRTGQLINMTDIGNDCGVSHNTIKSWLSVLEASYIIKLQKPYFKNISKRLSKSPKLYFLDTGLAAYLMGIKAPEHLIQHPLRGALFETLIVSEVIKNQFHNGEPDSSFFYRDHHGCEIDIVIDKGLSIDLIEVKSAETIKDALFKNFSSFPISEPAKKQQYLIYNGKNTQLRNNTKIVPWHSFSR